jgi:lysophospholipase
MFAASDGWKLRSVICANAAARATIILLTGRGDFAEKYSELMEDCLAQGYAVATLDWRGQGLSGSTTPPPRRTHVEDFALWQADAEYWIKKVVAAQCPQPWHLVTHSMGGNIGLRLLHDMPGAFRRAVVLAPLLGLQTPPFSVKFARRVAALAVHMGQGERFSFGQVAYGPHVHSRLRMDRLTSDKARFMHESRAIAANPDLAIGGVSFGWAHAAFRSCDLLASPGYAEAIEVPTLVMMAERETLVDNQATKTFTDRMPNAKTVIITDGRHELFAECDAIRTPVLAQIFAHVQAEPA